MPKSLKSAAKAKENDLFGGPEPKAKANLKVAARAGGAEAAYTARDIEVL
jgi:topoisomerase-4 subunit B